jgi:hypothetical protein
LGIRCGMVAGFVRNFTISNPVKSHDDVTGPKATVCRYRRRLRTPLGSCHESARTPIATSTAPAPTSSSFTATWKRSRTGEHAERLRRSRREAGHGRADNFLNPQPRRPRDALLGTRSGSPFGAQSQFRGPDFDVTRGRCRRLSDVTHRRKMACIARACPSESSPTRTPSSCTVSTVGACQVQAATRHLKGLRLAVERVSHPSSS